MHQELLGQPVTTVFPDRTPEAMRAAYDQLLQDPHGSELLLARHRRKDGTIIHRQQGLGAQPEELIKALRESLAP